MPVNESADTLKINELREAYSRHENYLPISGYVNTEIQPVFVETWFVDKQKILWQSVIASGSTQTGLTRIIQTHRNFKHYFFELNPEAGLNAFFPVLKDLDGTVWGGATNINRIFLHDTDGTVKQITPLDNETWKLAQRPRAFIEDSMGIWIGYFQKLLLYYDYATKEFSKVI